MDVLTSLSWIDALGWIATFLTVVSYSMNSMVPLRIFAILSSTCFLIYGALLQLWPIFGMELLLLPINIYRFWEVMSLRGRVSSAAASKVPDYSVIKAYGTARDIDAGTVIFRRGDAVDQLYFLETGRVVIEEFDIELTENDIFGEIAFFTDEATRTATARCLEPTTVYELTEKQFLRLQFEDPTFGLSIMRTVARRLTGNQPKAAPTTASAIV